MSPSAIPQPSQGYALVVTGRLPAAGIALERTALNTDDSVGGNADGVMDPGEWVDLPLTLFNSGDTPATNVTVRAESLTPGVEVVVDSAALPDIPTGQSASTAATHLQIHIAAGFPCSDPVHDGRKVFESMADARALSCGRFEKNQGLITRTSLMNLVQ